MSQLAFQSSCSMVVDPSELAGRPGEQSSKSFPSMGSNVLQGPAKHITFKLNDAAGSWSETSGQRPSTSVGLTAGPSSSTYVSNRNQSSSTQVEMDFLPSPERPQAPTPISGPRSMVGLPNLREDCGPNPNSDQFESQSILALAGSPDDDTTPAITSMRIGHTQRSRSKYEEAEESFRLAQANYLSLGDEQGHANALLCLGQTQLARSKYDDAEHSFTQALPVYKNANNGLGTASALRGLGELYSAQSKFGDAIKCFAEAGDAYDSIGDSRRRASILECLGNVQRACSRLSEAEESYSLAQSILVCLGDEKGQAGCLLGLAHIYFADSNYEQSLSLFRQALALYESTDESSKSTEGVPGPNQLDSHLSTPHEFGQDFSSAEDVDTGLTARKGQANALCGLGRVHRALSEYEAAQIAYFRAGQIYEGLGCELDKANVLRGVAEVQSLQARYEAAEESFEQAEGVYLSLGNDLGQANALLGVGQMRYRKADHAGAKESFARALGLYSGINHDLGQANALDGLGKTCFEQDQYEESKEHYFKARSIYARIGKRPTKLSEVRWGALLGLDEVAKDLGYAPSSVKMTLTQETEGWSARVVVVDNKGESRNGVIRWKAD